MLRNFFYPSVTSSCLGLFFLLRTLFWNTLSKWIPICLVLGVYVGCWIICSMSSCKTYSSWCAVVVKNSIFLVKNQSRWELDGVVFIMAIFSPESVKGTASTKPFCCVNHKPNWTLQSLSWYFSSWVMLQFYINCREYLAWTENNHTQWRQKDLKSWCPIFDSIGLVQLIKVMRQCREKHWCLCLYSKELPLWISLLSGRYLIYAMNCKLINTWREMCRT